MPSAWNTFSYIYIYCAYLFIVEQYTMWGWVRLISLTESAFAPPNSSFVHIQKGSDDFSEIAFDFWAFHFFFHRCSFAHSFFFESSSPHPSLYFLSLLFRLFVFYSLPFHFIRLFFSFFFFHVSFSIFLSSTFYVVHSLRNNSNFPINFSSC